MNINHSDRLNQIIKGIKSDIECNSVRCRVIECDKYSRYCTINNFKVNIYSIKNYSILHLYEIGYIYLCENHCFLDAEKSLNSCQIFVEQMLFEGSLDNSLSFLKKFSVLY